MTLRGVVRFRWRKGDALPRTAEVATEAGHRSSAGSDPAGYSAATLRARRLTEQAGVVGDDPGDAELLEPADPPAVVDGPHVELAAGLVDGLDQAR